MASGGWIGSYSALPSDEGLGLTRNTSTYVASFPAYFKIILLPPGWSESILASGEYQRESIES